MAASSATPDVAQGFQLWKLPDDTLLESASSREASGRVRDFCQRGRLARSPEEKAAEIDETRRLPEEVVARLRGAGMFRLLMPKDWGGRELSTIEQVEVVEEISRANSSRESLSGHGNHVAPLAPAAR